MKPRVRKRERKKAIRARNETNKYFLPCILFFALTLVLGAVSFAAFLQTSGFYPWMWEKFSITDIAPESGYNYIANLPSSNASSNGGFSPAKLFEDGKPLGPGDALHDDIRKAGKGRFSFLHNNLYFSTSDNTDPRANGRSYTAEWPQDFPSVYIYPLYMLFGGSLLVTIKLLRKSPVLSVRMDRGLVFIFQPHVLFYLSCMAVVVAFVLARIPWLIDFRMPFITYDTSSFFSILKRMAHGHWPDFWMRTPGYPLFLGLALGIAPYLMFVVAVQAILTLLSMLFFLYAVYKTCGRLVAAAGIAMVAHATQPFLAGLDFSLMSESLFTSFFLFFLGLFILSTHNLRSSLLLLCGLVGGMAIQIRPSGVFILEIMACGVIYLVANKAGTKKILAILLPAPLMLLALMTYNYFSNGIFTLSISGHRERSSILATSWEPDPSYTKEVNEGIMKLRGIIPEEEIRIVRESSDPQLLYNVLSKWSAYAVWSGDVTCTPKKGSLDRVGFICDSYLYSSTSNPDSSCFIKMCDIHLWDSISRKAIINHPDFALKLFLLTLHGFIESHSPYKVHLYTNISSVATQMYIGGTARDRFIGREFYEFPSDRALVIRDTPSGQRVELDDNKVKGRSLYDAVWNFSVSLFDNQWITVLYFITLFIASLRTIQTRFRHWGSFILFSISAALIGAGIAVALSAMIVDRYPAPTQFIEALSIGLLPLAWSRPNGQSEPTARKQDGEKSAQT